MKYNLTVYPENRIIEVEKNAILLDVLAKNGYYIPAACGGKGSCGKCKVKLLNGEVDCATPDEKGFVLSCKAKIKSDITIMLTNQQGSGLDCFAECKLEGDSDGFSIVLDVGTTTIASCLISLKTGEVVRKKTIINPQGVYGADVLSRIKACQEGNLEILQKLIIDKTQSLINNLCENGETIEELVVSANTTMLHIFSGVDPTPIGRYPFTPAFTNTQYLDGEKLGLSVKKVRLLPSASAYVGSDVIAGVLACGMLNDNKTELIVDVGTNGEIVLSKKGQFFAVSTAAGPALEGACIECGMGGVSGAIDKVRYDDGQLKFTTINNEQAIGLCGSGIIDLVAILVSEGLIDECGAWDEESNSKLVEKLIDGKFYITDEVYLSQGDIRQFQLAKSAIYAGIITLLKECNVDENQVENLYISGGLGYYMNVKSASITRLLPNSLIKHAKIVGNTSLSGARLCAISKKAQKDMETIIGKTKVIELSFLKTFQDLYVESMLF